MSESSTQDRFVISVAISPRSNDDRAKFQRALSELAQADPTIRIETESTVGQTIISGMSELHLEVICDRILHEDKIQLEVAKPRVIYVETIRKQAEAEARYIRQAGGRGQYAHVKLRLEPREPGSGYQFVDEITEGVVPPEFVEPVNFGIQEAMKGGILAGHEMVDLRAVLYDGSCHVADSNEMAFKIAASMAFKEAARKASPVIMEPVMSVDVVTPEDLVRSIVGDLGLRRGRIEGMEHRAGSRLITAIAPLAEMLGYASHMRSITQGRAGYSMHFAHYQAAPSHRRHRRVWNWMKPALPPTDPKVQKEGVASLLPSWTRNPSDRKFKSVISLYHIFCDELDKKHPTSSQHKLGQPFAIGNLPAVNPRPTAGPGCAVGADERAKSSTTSLKSYKRTLS